MIGFTLIGAGIGGICAYFHLNSKNYIVDHKQGKALLRKIENMMEELKEEEQETVTIEEPKTQKDIIIELENYLNKIDEAEVED
jgi:CHASE3 domain sensor protein